MAQELVIPVGMSPLLEEFSDGHILSRVEGLDRRKESDSPTVSRVEPKMGFLLCQIYYIQLFQLV